MKRTWKSIDSIALAVLAGVGPSAACVSSESVEEPLGQLRSALVPPPPVNQNLGVYDKVFGAFTAEDCRGCHQRGGTSVSPVHHALLDSENPHYKPNFDCLTCHSLTFDPGCNCNVIQATHDCTICHTSSPHHASSWANDRHCSHCHGSLITDYDDGHYIPAYAKTSVTPVPGCRVWTDETRTVCKSGGCRACHAESTAVTPNIASTGVLHHAAIRQCTLCHSVHGGLFDIRLCEQCHGVQSLHSIEYNAEVNLGVPGWGHIGADEDCWGCHGAYSRGDLPTQAGAASPTIARVEPSVVKSGSDTEITVTGTGFTRPVALDGMGVTAPRLTLVLSRSGGRVGRRQELALEPSSMSESRLTATLPATIGRGTWEVRVHHDHGSPSEKRSNLSTLTVVPGAALTSAALNGALVIEGRNFGPEPDRMAALGVFVGEERCSVTQWSQTRIVASCASAVAGTTVKVKTIFDEVSSAIVGGPEGQATPKAP